LPPEDLIEQTMANQDLDRESAIKFLLANASFSDRQLWDNQRRQQLLSSLSDSKSGSRVSPLSRKYGSVFKLQADRMENPAPSKNIPIVEGQGLKALPPLPPQQRAISYQQPSQTPPIGSSFKLAGERRVDPLLKGTNLQQRLPNLSPSNPQDPIISPEVPAHLKGTTDQRPPF
jgi:hypothetical protein